MSANNESLIDRLKRQFPLNAGYQENGACLLPLSLDNFWSNFLADECKLSWIEFWQQCCEGRETMITEWSASNIPS